ncbi:MAG: hypothetical protein WC919_00070 [Candidatus Paceibacterota bacterium]|jgi:hypothetical protein
MSRFYPHVVENEVAIHDAMMAEASKVGEMHSDAWFVEFNLRHLEGVAANGLPDCYDDFEDFLWDFYPGLSWKPEERKNQIRSILDSPRFAAAAAQIQSDWGFDMRADLEKSDAEPVGV